MNTGHCRVHADSQSAGHPQRGGAVIILFAC
jgi:hypothetical protein